MANTPKKKLPWSATEPAGNRYSDEVAATYLAERVNKPVWAAEESAVATYLSTLPTGSKIIDVPFGTGRFAPLYIANGWRASGVEISEPMLEVARQEIGQDWDGLDIRQGDAFELPYPDNHFDAACLHSFR